MHLTLTIPDLNHTEPLKEAMRGLYQQAQIFCFKGELGAGKTTYIKMLCKELGVEEEMSSPSFALVNEYITNDNRRILHFDLYRLKHPDELLDIGWEEYLKSGDLIFVEWPENGGTYIPDDAIFIEIEHDPLQEQRTLTLIDQP